MPRTFEIALPDAKGRLDILKLQLKKQRLHQNAVAFLPNLAKAAVGFSGSDLQELVRTAKMEPIREITRKYSETAVMKGRKSGERFGPPAGEKVRPVEKR